MKRIDRATAVAMIVATSLPWALVLIAMLIMMGLQ
jgi:hypothetical protein